MAISYKKLWKLLIDKDMKKKDLQKLTDVICLDYETWEKPITNANEGTKY